MRTLLIAARRRVDRASRHRRRKGVQLKKAPGLDKVEANCASLPQSRLHPDELAVSQCGGLGRRGHQMIKAFGAPIDDADAKGHRRLPEEELRNLKAGLRR